MLSKLLASDQPTPQKAGMSTTKLCDLYLSRTEGNRNENLARPAPHHGVRPALPEVGDGPAWRATGRG
jgi:hypothetical protein